MRRLFQWFKQRRESQLYDIASESWDPIGPTDTNIDWSSWLEEEAPRRPARVRVRPMAPVTPREASRAGEPSVPRATRMPASAHQEGPADAPQPGRDSRPRIHTPPPSEGQWVEVLKSYGEHLTEEELLIIRRQLVAR